MKDLELALEQFAQENDFLSTTGAICVGLVVAERARSMEFPISPSDLKTARGGQVKGLSGSAVKSILAKHGEERIFSKEGGRTNRGALDNMTAYVGFLNFHHANGDLDLNVVQAFWASQATAFLDRDPFKLRLDSSWSTHAIVGDLMRQADERQSTGGGTHFAGALMQHLVGAKIDCIYGKGKVSHHSFTTSDDQQGRLGDFEIGSTSIHVTTFPTVGLLDKFEANLRSNLSPMLVSSSEGIAFARRQALGAKIADRIEFVDIQQFIATNVLEKSRFDQATRNAALTDIIDRYNEIIEEFETHLSLKIDYK